MYDGGRMIKSHFHSTPIQILVERGIPGLTIWMMILGIYARTLWRGFQMNQGSDWRTTGIILGSLGGLIGFIISGFVQSNIIDSVVAMTFYLIMGLSVRIAELSSENSRIESQQFLGGHR
jgi:O-antigen ligase